MSTEHTGGDGWVRQMEAPTGFEWSTSKGMATFRCPAGIDMQDLELLEAVVQLQIGTMKRAATKRINAGDAEYESWFQPSTETPE